MVDPGTADEALGILRSGQEQVRRESRRREVIMLGVKAVSTVLWHAKKDIRDPVLRRACHVALLLGTGGYAVWMADRMKVMGLWSERRQRALAEMTDRMKALQESGELPGPKERVPVDQQVRTFVSGLTPEMRQAFALVLAMSAARVVVVAGLRRSKIPYPNLAAGVVIAAMNTTIGLIRMRKRRADDS